MKDSFVVVGSVVVLIESTEFLNVCCYHVQTTSLKVQLFVDHFLKPWRVAVSAVIEFEVVVSI